MRVLVAEDGVFCAMELEELLLTSNKVIIEPGGGEGVVPYRPWPEIQQRQASRNQNSSQSVTQPSQGGGQ